MHTIGLLFYVISTRAYALIIRLLAPFNRRAAQFVQGRKNIFNEIADELETIEAKRIWFHVSSLGEYEQGRPLMEALKEKFPGHKILVTFFSPSGYENRKEDKAADFIFYLPFDTHTNATTLLDLFKPEMVFWVKYDFWYFYLSEISRRKIPLYLISAAFRPEQLFFKWYGAFYRRVILLFNHIFCQNNESIDLLKRIGYRQCTLSRDTRYDRVFQSLNANVEVPLITAFKGNNELMVAGSSYENEEALIENNLRQSSNLKVIVAPHFIDAERIASIKKRFPNAVKYSKADLDNVQQAQVLIIDNIGLLKHIYKYADLVFVGGGFWPGGLHNTLEPAAYGNPILFGPHLEKFPEARMLRDRGAAFVVKSQQDYDGILTRLRGDRAFYERASLVASHFIEENKGATQIIMKQLFD